MHRKCISLCVIELSVHSHTAPLFCFINADCSTILSSEFFSGFTLDSGHLSVALVLQLFGFVVVRSHFQQPVVFDLDHISHVLFCRQHQLVVDEEPRQVLEHRTVRVNHHRLVVLHCLVISTFGQTRRVIKVA